MHSIYPVNSPRINPPGQPIPLPTPETPMPQRVQQDIDRLFHCCRDDDWKSVLAAVQADPWIALTPMVMDNHISTTILHQAITSKADTALRAQVISTILRATPRAAAIKNGYGSLPLHVIAQRNVKMDAQTKERLIFEMVPAYPEALTEQGGVGKRTPLHIIFTDYISPRLTRMMIENGADACFMKDKKGFLPAHVACMRHCSPEKLRMLLAVNPNALYDKTNDHQTLLDLASHKATKAHPNYALIDELNKQLAGDVSHYDPVVFSTPTRRRQSVARTGRRPPPTVVATAYPSYHHVTYPPYHHAQYIPASGEYIFHSPPHSQQPPYHYQYQQPHPNSMQHPYMAAGRVSSEDEDVDAWNNRSRLDSNETWISPTEPPQGSLRQTNSLSGDVNAIDTGRRNPHDSDVDYNSNPTYWHPAARESVVSPARIRKKRKSPDPAAHLLLHFSRTSETTGETAVASKSPPRHEGYPSSNRTSQSDMGALSSRVAEV